MKTPRAHFLNGRRPRNVVRQTLSIIVMIGMGSGLLLAQSSPPKFNPPKNYYLALGDSVTYGYQRSKVLAGLPPSGFNTGYVDDFGARLRQIQPGITIVNFGCPGETTDSFITGPCQWSELGFQLHDNFSGSQLDAAVAFLQAHLGDVSPITITLWGNDIAQFVGSCGGDPACIQNGAPRLIARISTNLTTALSRLRMTAPDAEIIVTGAWDSFIGAFEFADPLFQTLNTSMANEAAAARARFADPFPVFNPQGDLNAETQAICTLTLLCTEGDSHPSDSGYQALADVVFGVSDYGRLIDLGSGRVPSRSNRAYTSTFGNHQDRSKTSRRMLVTAPVPARKGHKYDSVWPTLCVY